MSTSQAPSFEDVVIDFDGQEKHQYSATTTTTTTTTSSSSASSSTTGMDKVTLEVGKTIADNVLKAGTQSAKSFFDTYARIDLLRPYFDVEPIEIRARLLHSLYPRATLDAQVVPGDLYGPTMLAFTLVAVLLLGMKSSNHLVTNQEGTIIGTAFAVSFGYWLTASSLFYGICFIFNTNMTLTEILSSTGYGLLSYNLVLLISLLRPSPDRDFYIAWLVIGLLGSSKLALLMRSRTNDRKQGFILAIVVLAVQQMYLLYLKYAYVRGEPI
eukprot:m.53068 g.53068  ORF g.53068 m.53068 type:complete len:270 (+) comp13126_c0_seq1:148-957(+)